MAKPTIKFTAVPYEIGTHSGLRPQLESQEPVMDLDFTREVVTEKRLAMSAEELLHGVQMLAEVAGSRICTDGRPRGISRFMKWNRYAQGKLESTTSPWNETCRAYIRPQLLSESEKDIDASFVNVNDGINVKLDNVTYIGAQSVTNVIKIGKPFAAYGKHMEWLEGDTAKLVIGLQTYDLSCSESDVAHATFGWPPGATAEAGTQVTFVMNTRGGIAEGQVYTSKKVVTLLPADVTSIGSVYSEGHESEKNTVYENCNVIFEGEALKLEGADMLAYVGTKNGQPASGAFTSAGWLVNTDTKLKLAPTATTGDAFSFDNATLVSFTWHEKTVTAIFKTGGV